MTMQLRSLLRLYGSLLDEDERQPRTRLLERLQEIRHPDVDATVAPTSQTAAGQGSSPSPTPSPAQSYEQPPPAAELEDPDDLDDPDDLTRLLPPAPLGFEPDRRLDGDWKLVATPTPPPPGPPRPTKDLLEIQGLELLIATAGRYQRIDSSLVEVLEIVRPPAGADDENVDGRWDLLRSLIAEDATERDDQALRLASIIDEVVQSTRAATTRLGQLGQPVQHSGPFVLEPVEDDGTSRGPHANGAVPVSVDSPGRPSDRPDRPIPVPDHAQPSGPPGRGTEAETMSEASDGKEERATYNQTDLVMLSCEAEGIPLDEALVRQPSITCTGTTFPVDTDDGGEYAIYLETVTFFDGDRFPDLTADRIATALFDPRNWPQYHPFWCSMVDLDMLGPDNPELGQELMDELRRQRDAIDDGDTDDGRMIIWEKVGICDRAGANDDFFPRTILYFRPQHHPKRRTLLYDQLPVGGDFRPRSALGLDNGFIRISERGGGVEVMITKTLLVRGIGQQTEAHSMSRFACEAGWADETRHLIVKAIESGTLAPGQPEPNPGNSPGGGPP